MKTDERSRKRTNNQRKKESRCHKGLGESGSKQEAGPDVRAGARPWALVMWGGQN